MYVLKSSGRKFWGNHADCITKAGILLFTRFYIATGISAHQSWIDTSDLGNFGNIEVRKIIEERKQKELAARKAMKENVVKESHEKNNNIKKKQIISNRGFDRGR